MSGKRISRWDRASRWDKDFSVRQEKPSRSGISDFADARNSTISAVDRSQPREIVAHKDGLAGLIFMCSSRTKHDCFRYKVFGLPLARRDIVERVIPGTTLFLFDFDVRELYGIYEAVSFGGMNLEPKAFQNIQGSYPAQVRFDIYRECLPLSEDIFKDAIKENYYARNKFNFELTADQVSKLIQLFCPIEPPRKRVDSRSNIPEAVELSYPVSQYRLPSLASRMDERLSGYVPHAAHEAQEGGGYTSLLPRKRAYDDLLDPLASRALERLEPGPVHIDAGDKAQLSQMKPSYEIRLPVTTGLLDKDRIEEVDQLALKYLQPANPGGAETGIQSLNPYHRTPVLSQAEHVASRIGLVAALRDQESRMHSMQLIPGFSNNMPNMSSAVPLGRRVVAAEPLRQPVGHGAVRRRFRS